MELRGIYMAKKQCTSGPRGIRLVLLLSVPNAISYFQVLPNGQSKK
jgi:hypothetical protein